MNLATLAISYFFIMPSLVVPIAFFEQIAVQVFKLLYMVHTVMESCSKNQRRQENG
jgi:hypothetical protein